MFKLSSALTSFEGTVLWRFLDGVSSAIASRMALESRPNEENLTFILCELLDQRTTGLHSLDYPLSRVREELERSDIGIKVDFETHAHSRFFESRVSGADLGIVVTMEHPLLGRSQRAFLIQAKRLFPRGNAGQFSLLSAYESFEAQQAAVLRDLAERFAAAHSVFYLWYNPPSAAFTADDARIIRAYEAMRSTGTYPSQGLDPVLDEVVDVGIPPAHGQYGVSGKISREEEEEARDWRRRQPALRVSELEVVLPISESRTVPSLKALYQRVWSDGPSEIVLSNQGMRWQKEASSDTFRFVREAGSAMPKLSAGDALGCLANILGLSTTNWNSAISVLSSLACSSSFQSTFEDVQTLLHCFSMISVGVANITSTAGCIIGAADLVGCSILACGGTPGVPGGLSASQGAYADHVHVAWNASSGASSYKLYRSTSSSSAGSLLISQNGTSFDDYQATPGTQYYYNVAACSTFGCSSVSGYAIGWRSSSSTGCVTYTGSLGYGGYAYQPNGSYYYSSAPGTHSGTLNAPAGTGFFLYLWAYNGGQWTLIRSSTNVSNVQSLSYYGGAGYYLWEVSAYIGSGSYSFCLSHP